MYPQSLCIERSGVRKMKNETKEFIKRNERKIKIAFNIGVGIAFLSALLTPI